MGNSKVPNNLSRYSFLIIIVISVLVLSYVVKNPLSTDAEKISYSKFIEYSEKEGQIAEIKYMDTQSKIHGKLKNGDAFTVSVPKESKSVDDVLAQLSKQGVNVSIEPPGFKENFGSLLYMIVIPALFFLGLWFLIMRQSNVGGNQAMNFGRSRAKRLQENEVRVTFKDVAGVDEAKEELEEVIEFLREPKRFQELGAKIPKGLLMIGPPGSGKTLLARAVAGEAKVPFFHMSGSDFVEMFVGVGASRVRDLFDQAKKSAPCLVFVDEIDAVGRQRGAGLGGGHDEREQTLNQLLVEMDGFDPNVGVIVIAATNRPDVLDPALLRPGRFDRRIVVDRPDVVGRRAILEVHARDKKLASDVDLEIIARRTPGFTGADLENVMNEGALLAARRNQKTVTQDVVEEAIERNIAGPQRKSRLMSEKSRKITAFHEAGHALVARLLPDTDPVHKISILPRGMALGYTLQLPLEDKYMTAKSELLDNICVLLGGRMAEELVFGRDHITTGAANDLEKVKKISRKMVCEFGMSENLGPLTFGDKEENVFLGRALAEGRDYSEDVAFQIDQEIRKIVERCYRKTEKLLTEHSERLTLVAEKLMEKEMLDGVLLEALLDGRDMPQDEVDTIEAERKVERQQQRLREIEEDRKRREGDDAGEFGGDAGDADQPVASVDQPDDGNAPEPEAEVADQAAAAAVRTTEPALPETGRAVQSIDGLMVRFPGMLLETFNSEYRPKLTQATCGDTFQQADDKFNEQDYMSAIESLQASIRKCRDNKLVPGLRILLGLAYFRQGNVERLSDELMAALMAAPSGLEKNVERLLVSAISYFRILNEEMKRNNLTVGRLPEVPDAVKTVDSRYKEWEQRTGYTISADIMRS